MKTWHLVLALIVLFSTGILIITVIRSNLKGDEKAVSAIDTEIAKAALNGSIVAVIGSAIAALVKAREQRILAARFRYDLLAQFIQRLSELYRSVKATRRRLRSLGLTAYYGKPPSKLDNGQLKEYAEEMTSISKAQLSLEDLKIQAVRLPPFKNLGGVAQRLRDMEDYLRVVLKESESAQLNIQSHNDVSFSKLFRLNEFTTSTSKNSPVPITEKKSDYRFSTHFAAAFDDILEKISRNLSD